MTGKKSLVVLLGCVNVFDCRRKTQGTQRQVRDRVGCFLCALCVLLRPMIRSWRGRAELFALATVLISRSLFAQSPRLEVIQAMLQRPNDPWPRGKGHVVLAVPGCSEASKGYHEPGGSFSPSFGSFGVSIWVADNDGKIVATGDSLPPDEIDQDLARLTNRKLRAIQ